MNTEFCASEVLNLPQRQSERERESERESESESESESEREESRQRGLAAPELTVFECPGQTQVGMLSCM